MSLTIEDNWRWCGLCHGLYYAGNARVFGDSAPGRCAGHGDGHRVNREFSALYTLLLEGETLPGLAAAPGQSGWRQPGWRRCRRCETLWYADGHSRGECFAGGEHTDEGGARYVLPLEGGDQEHERGDQEHERGDRQAGWRWCHKCQGLWYAGPAVSFNRFRVCPAGGCHSAASSPRYALDCTPRELVWLDAASGPQAARGRVGLWVDRREIRGLPETGPLAWPGQPARAPAASHPGRPGVRFDALPDTAPVVPPTGLVLTWRGAGRTLLGLWETPYTAIVVVQRTSARGENYPLASAGLAAGLFGRAPDSALHLGWQADGRVRFGQWADDLDLAGTPAYDPDREVVAILCAVAGRTGRLLALDEPGFSRDSGPVPGGRLLRAGPRGLALGAPPGEEPDFAFAGHVFELILWEQALSPRQLGLKRAVLRQKYGVGAVDLGPGGRSRT